MKLSNYFIHTLRRRIGKWRRGWGRNWEHIALFWLNKRILLMLIAFFFFSVFSFRFTRISRRWYSRIFCKEQGKYDLYVILYSLNVGINFYVDSSIYWFFYKTYEYLLYPSGYHLGPTLEEYQMRFHCKV